MPDNPSEFPYPDGFSLELVDGAAQIEVPRWDDEHAFTDSALLQLDANQLRRLGTEALAMSALMLSGTLGEEHGQIRAEQQREQGDPGAHPCSHPAEGAARRIMRDIEDGHLTLRVHNRGNVSGDYPFSRAGAAYAIFWGWLQPDQQEGWPMSLRPTESWALTARPKT